MKFIQHTLFTLITWVMPIVTSLTVTAALPPAISPKSVAILYNNQDKQSEKLANYYAKARNIPKENLIGLKLSNKDEISRSEYQSSIQRPLRDVFLSRGWWKMTKTPDGKILAGASKITTLVCMRGVPYKIKRRKLEKPYPKKLLKLMSKQLLQANEASVDSELVMLSVQNLPIYGPLNNPYYNKTTGIASAKLPYYLLVGRIDGPSYATCQRMIDDAITIEKRGLWGMAYLDLAKKGGNYKMGDDWILKIEKLNDAIGIPTVIDKNKQTFPTNYPMNDAAIYFGWYTGKFNGPLLNSTFKFRQGAVAVHLHSFSASHLRSSKQNWTGPILEKGAAATLGNVYEPFLHLTHHFDIFYDRLLRGYSLVEAAYMACPSTSWQNVVLGDPLYRPFLHLDGSGEKKREDIDFRGIRMAHQIWGDQPEKMTTKLRTKAAEKANARYYEYLGLWQRAHGNNQVAIAFFQTASKKHILDTDRLRQWLYTADIQREIGNKQLAIATLKKAKTIFKGIPEIKSVTALLNILDPPQPSPAKKKK